MLIVVLLYQTNTLKGTLLDLLTFKPVHFLSSLLRKKSVLKSNQSDKNNSQVTEHVNESTLSGDPDAQVPQQHGSEQQISHGAEAVTLD